LVEGSSPSRPTIPINDLGYYTTHGENVADVMAVAAPLGMGTSTFGVAIAGPLQRLAGHEAALGKKLVRALKMLEGASGAGV